MLPKAIEVESLGEMGEETKAKQCQADNSIHVCSTCYYQREEAVINEALAEGKSGGWKRGKVIQCGRYKVGYK
jgi:hypothetical protein